MDEKQKITEETKRNLFHYTQLNIQATSEMLAMLREHIMDLDILKNEREGYNLPSLDDEHHLRKLVEYTILLGLISQDLSATYRNYLNAKEAYEVQYATKHIVIILNEGFKKIYNYVWKNEKGDLKTAGRTKSIWSKDIGLIVNNKLPHMKSEYDRLTIKLNTFDDATLKSMKVSRNIFVHYDDIPSIAYDQTQNINIEIVSQKAIPFMNIIKQMLDFSFLLTQNYVTLLTAKTEAAFDEHYKILENLKSLHPNNPLAFEIIEKGQQNLLDIQMKYKNPIR